MPLNFRILFKSVKLAFRAKKRVFAFIIIYAILFLAIGKGLQASALALETAWPYLLMAFIVATVYAVLISQFRRRDIAILKCISWSNNEVILLVVGEVIIVALSAFLVIFQLSVEILGIIAYFSEWEPRHLETVLELSYASKLAKEIMVVDDRQPRKSWVHALPYSTSFSNLEILKVHLTKNLLFPRTQPRIFG